jgi:hypothetical protein
MSIYIKMGLGKEGYAVSYMTKSKTPDQHPIDEDQELS